MQIKRHTSPLKFAIGYGAVICLCLILTACNDISRVRIINGKAKQHGFAELVAVNTPSQVISKKKVEASSSVGQPLTTESSECDDVEPLEKPKRLHSLVPSSQDSNRLRPGHTTASFELPNLEGEQIALDDVLDDNDYVLIDFWASWCSPCIEEFSKLKNLRSSYNDHGFEVVSVSLDEESADWIEMSREQSLPWINLADTDGPHGPTASAYSVEGIPRKYLVDGNGCILHTDISNTKLETFLKSTYGIKEQSDSDDPEALRFQEE